MRWPTLAPTLTLSLLLAVALPVGAQQVVGVVMDQESDEGIEGAELVMRDTAGVVLGRAATDEKGMFLVALERGGAFTMTVSRIGYQPYSSELLDVEQGERLAVEVRLGVRAVPLEPLVVSSRSRVRSPAIDAFYERLAHGRRTGGAHFFSRADIEDARPGRTTDLLRRVAGVRVVSTRAGGGDVVRMRGGCIPAIFIDGAHINRHNSRDSLDDYVAPLNIEGMEVYRSGSQSVEHYHDPRGCGLILVWTRRGEMNPGEGVGWRTILAVLGALLGLMLVLN